MANKTEQQLVRDIINIREFEEVMGFSDYLVMTIDNDRALNVLYTQLEMMGCDTYALRYARAAGRAKYFIDNYSD